MPIAIPKLSATPIRPRRFKSGLLHSDASKTKEAKDLRDIYGEIAGEWDGSGDEAAYRFAEPRTRELLLGTDDPLAGHDFDTAAMYAHSGDWKRATAYLGHALTKIAASIEKLGYGYDTSGEVHGGGGTSGTGKHLWDTGNAPKHDHTQNNPANMLFDAEAESDYPELREFKHKRVHWPPRTR